MSSIVAPIFEVRPLAWQAPDPADFDALMLTSANAPRHAGAGLAGLTALRCYCVGEATAEAARAAGFRDLRIGPSDGDTLLKITAGDGVRKLLHLSGRDHVGLEHPDIRITRIPVYAADPLDHLPVEAVRALEAGALALLHSPRAARIFAGLVDAVGLERARIRIAAISRAAEAAAGPGWALSAAAAAPRDEALLELAAELCNKGAVSGTGLAQ